MSNLRLLVILILILVVLSFIQKEGLGSKNQKKNVIVSTPTPKATPAQTPIPTPIPTLVPSTSIPIPSSQRNISSFAYPGSIILSKSEKEMTLQSLDDPQAITNWYKEKIISAGVNAKSFVTTNTNGNVLNKLVGAKSGFKISVEISKKNNEGKTEISVIYS